MRALQRLQWRLLAFDAVSDPLVGIGLIALGRDGGDAIPSCMRRSPVC